MPYIRAWDYSSLSYTGSSKSSSYPLCAKPYSEDEAVSASSLKDQNRATVAQQQVPSSSSHSLLHGAQLHSDNEFSLRWHVLENISFETPQHVWAQHVMQLLDLIFLGNICKLFQEALQVTAEKQTLSKSNKGKREKK